jgi:hypothetical protein
LESSEVEGCRPDVDVTLDHDGPDANLGPSRPPYVVARGFVVWALLDTITLMSLPKIAGLTSNILTRARVPLALPTDHFPESQRARRRPC